MEGTFNDLSTFNWEANPNETDFFGIKAEQYQEQVEKDKPVETTTEEKEEPTDLETSEENLFSNFTNSEESEEVDKPEKGTVFYKGKDTKEIYGTELENIRRTELSFIFQDF